MDGLYRDPLTALRQDVLRKQSEVQALEAELPARALALLSDETHEALAHLRAASATPGETLAQLSELDRVLSERREALAGATREVAAARVLAAELAMPEAPADPVPFLLEERFQLAARDGLREAIRAIDPGGFIRRWGDASYLGRFESGGAPFVLTLTGEPSSIDSGLREWHVWLGTVAPVGYGAARVHPWHALDRLKAWLHLGDAVPLSSAGESRYVAQGPGRLVAALFDDATCGALVALPGDVDIEIAPGQVSLRWTGAPLTRAHLDLAARLAHH